MEKRIHRAMTDIAAISCFGLAARELRALWITITRLPGEYCMNTGPWRVADAHGKQWRGSSKPVDLAAV
jgi:hypothetical protein